MLFVPLWIAAEWALLAGDVALIITVARLSIFAYKFLRRGL